MKTSLEALNRVLGGRSLLGQTARDEGDLIALIREGLPYASFEHALEDLELTLDEVASQLGLQRRTLSRRKGQRLNHEESERVLRLLRVILRAVDVLGSREKAFQWLRRPNRALGGQPPLSLLDVELGARQVEDVLGRIEHGVYS